MSVHVGAFQCFRCPSSRPCVTVRSLPGRPIVHRCMWLRPSNTLPFSHDTQHRETRPLIQHSTTNQLELHSLESQSSSSSNHSKQRHSSTHCHTYKRTAANASSWSIELNVRHSTNCGSTQTSQLIYRVLYACLSV